MKLLQLSEYGARICAPPAWAGDDYVVVLADVVQIFFQLWTGIVPLLLLRDFGAFHIVCRIVLDCFDLKEIRAYCVLNVLCDKLGIAHFEVFQLAAYIILSLAGIIYDQILCHLCYLFLPANLFACCFILLYHDIFFMVN